MEASHRHTMWGPKYNHEIDELHDLARKLCLRFEYCIKDKAQNEKTFTCSLKIGNFSAKARGHTKWVAKIEATKLVLGDLRRLLPGKDTYLRSKNPANVSGYRKEAPLFTAGTNPVICLENLVNANEVNPPKYTVLSSRGDEMFKVQVSMADNGVVGIGHTYIEAKCNAADRLLHTLGYSFPYTELQQDACEAVASAAPQNYDTKEDTKEKCSSNQKDSIQVPEVTQSEKNEPVSKPGTNPVISLKNLVHANQGIRPKYTMLSCRGDEMFKLHVTVAENSAEGIGSTYGEAKCNAADRMLNAFGYSFPYTEIQQKVTPLLPQDASEAVVSAAPQNYDTKDTKEKCSSNQDSLQVPEVTQSKTNETVSKPGINPVICLKNLVYANQGIRPKYTVLSSRGDEMFKLQVTVAENSAEGIGSTYGEAKCNAADRMLNALGYSFPYTELQEDASEAVASAAPQNYDTKEETKVTPCPSNQDSLEVPKVIERETNAPVFKPSTNPVISLKNLVNAYGGKPPKYTVVSCRGDEIFKLQLTVAKESVVGIGSTYGEAKRNAADQMLKTFDRPSNPEEYSLQVPTITERETPALLTEEPVFIPGMNPVFFLENLSIARQWKPPKYTMLPDLGDETLQVQVTVAGQSVVGKGPTCNKARMNAAAGILKIFGYSTDTEEDEEEVTPLPTEGAMATSQNYDLTPCPSNLEYTPQVPAVTRRKTPELYNVTSSVADDNSVQVQELLMKVLPSIAFMKMNDNCKETVLLSNEKVSTQKKDLLAAKEVIEDHSGYIELSEPKTTKTIATETIADTPEVILDDSCLDIQEVAQGDAPQIDREVLSPSVDQLPAKEVIGDSGNIELSEPETKESPSETVLPSEVIEECPLKTTQTIVADTKDKMSYVDLQTLCPKMRSLLASMQVVKEHDGIVQWDLSKPTKRIQDSQTLSPPENTTTMDTSDAPVEKEGHAIGTNTSSQTTVVSDETENDSSTAVVNVSREESVINHSNSTHQEESQTDNSSPVLHFGPLGNSILTCALVEKTFKKACSREEYDALVKRLEKKTIDALTVCDDIEISSEKLREMGKKAAQKLLKEYGTRSNLLEAARRTDDKAFEEAVVKHLNIQMVAYKNRPKSALSRLWSRIRSAFARSS